MRNKRRDRIGKLLFLLPVIFVVAVVIFAIFSYVTTQTGTLEIMAQSSARFFPEIQLNAQVQVSNQAGTTPFQVTLPQGTYYVTFGPLSWYSTPPPKTVSIPGGLTVYAVGVYNPIMRVIEIDRAGFNSSQITALHGVTPVIWKNFNGTDVVLQGDAFGQAIISAGHNFTYIYTSPGSFSFQLLFAHQAGTVKVS
jgi:hypothetical protein